ncbi:MAG: hypothetical protein ACXW3Q_10000 [Rhodoplanes sp.]|jgi:hypothetical protein
MRESFYCVVHGRGNEWEGLCLDLDIAVHGDSFVEVKSLMSEAISTYVEDALKEEEPARSALLNRAAPFRVRAYWAFRIALAALRGRKRDSDLPVGYPEPCRG